MNNHSETLLKIKRFIRNTPLNRNYIADLSLKKRIIETIPHVKGHVLDVGCGEKPYEPIFLSNIKKYVGIDIPNAHIFYSPNISADVYGNACYLPFSSETFDTLLCIEVLPHIDKPSLAFSEFARVLKPGGNLIVTADKSWEERTGLPVPDYWRFTGEGVAILSRQQGLTVLYTKQGCGFFATIGQLLARFLNKELIYRKALHKGIDREPNILVAFFIIPIIALVQIFFLLLDKIYYSSVVS
ncbi:MAG: class I SAM-dependent methyltransferase [Waddliaceae bacterium]